MAGLTLAPRDLVATQHQLGAWFEHEFGRPVTIRDLGAANRATGWSSESLKFAAVDGEDAVEYVIRIPPAGGGVFAEYDLEGQARTQQLVAEFGIATATPVFYEPDARWIGSKFLVMPRIVGHTPSDASYAVKGWIHGAGADVQRRAHDAFLHTLGTLKGIPVERAPWLERPGGTGNGAEMQWWHEYVSWGTDNAVPDVIEAGFDWLKRHRPDEPEPSICWGDARLSNGIFDDSGQLIAALDWEQACLCPAENDLAWWLATRRQALELHGITSDPELPGFDSREGVIRRYENMIGRPTTDLKWYEIFSMVRMGCCIVRTQLLLRSIGQADHGFMQAPVLPAWTIAEIKQ